MPIAKITSDRNQANLPQDLVRYCQLALKLGADEARVVDASKIPVEDAVAFKCRVPQCFGYNNCAQCPPHAAAFKRLQAGLTAFGGEAGKEIGFIINSQHSLHPLNWQRSSIVRLHHASAGRSPHKGVRGSRRP